MECGDEARMLHQAHISVDSGLSCLKEYAFGETHTAKSTQFEMAWNLYDPAQTKVNR